MAFGCFRGDLSWLQRYRRQCQIVIHGGITPWGEAYVCTSRNKFKRMQKKLQMKVNERSYYIPEKKKAKEE